MKTQIQKWGNSLALRLPKSLANEAKISQGSTVIVSLERGRIVVEPIAEAEFSLQELLAKINKHNRHKEIEFGDRVGKEAW